MILVVSSVLSEEALDAMRKVARGLVYRDGAATAGEMAKPVKHNEQADLSSRAGAALRDDLLEAVRTNPIVVAAARPRRFARPLLSRTGQGGGYGPHVDNALMAAGVRDEAGRVRTDIAFTLFLSDPADYDGGDLVIETAGETRRVKPAAGDLVLYNARYVHAVATVTRGERLAFVSWIESEVRDPVARETLFDLENLSVSLAQTHSPQSPERLILARTIANLIRMWADA